METLVQWLNPLNWLSWARDHLQWLNPLNWLSWAQNHLQWLNPLNWLSWAQDHPWLALIIIAPVIGFILWRLGKGGEGALGARRGITLIIWGALAFADWVQPTLTPQDLFTPPVVGPQAVKAALAEQKTIERWATYTGAVHPYERVVLQARMEGFVEDIAVYPGDRVEKGQIVVRQEISEREPKLAEAEAQLRFAKAEYERDKLLFEGGAISGSAFDLSRQRWETAAATVKLLKTEIGYATVRALSDGWVSKRAVDPGQYARKGDHLLAYDRLDRVRIRLDVAVQDLVHIAPGATVILEFREIPAERFAGSALGDMLEHGFQSAAVRTKVTYVFPMADERSRLATIEVLIPNPDLILKSNTYVVAHVVTGRAEDAWVVPATALTPMPEGKTVIFMAPAFAEQGPVEMREVKVGLRNGREVQILEGLNEPAYVVTAGNRSVIAGETVKVVAREGGF